MIRFCLLLSFLITTSASAQSFRIGIEGGLHAISLDYKKPPSEWSGVFRPAGSAMISAVIPVVQRFSVQTGVRYVRLGNRESFDFVIESNEPDIEPIRDTGWFTYTQNYLSIPVRLRYTLLDHIYLFAGPELGYLLSARTHLEHSSTFTEATETQDQSITRKLERINVSATVGIGSALRLLGQDFYAQVMYGRGLRTLGKTGNFGFPWCTQEMGLTVGYLF